MESIVYSQVASDDIYTATVDLLDRSRGAAVPERFRKLLKEKLELLATHQLAGEACPHLGVDQMRQFPIRGFQYIIFYRPTANGIEVLRVIHGSRDIEAIFRRNT